MRAEMTPVKARSLGAAGSTVETRTSAASRRGSASVGSHALNPTPKERNGNAAA